MYRNSLNIILFSAIIACSTISLKAQVKITDGSVLTMDPNSLLELESSNRGLLIPRMAINNLNLASPLVGTVPAGMQVYSLGGSVPDGFYYWNSSSWVRFIAGTDPAKNLNLVSKSANATLLKTENMVLASGNITLTLPLITVADNGLEITIKNVGTYTDLVTVIPQSGKTLDQSSNSILTRWKSRTFIASGTNWVVKEKETRMDNLLGVSESGSFITIAEVVAFLNAHMTGPTVVQLGAGIYQVSATQNINLPFPVTFEGLSFGETTIDATSGVSGSPLFSCASECYFKKLTFNSYANTSGNDAIRFTGSGIYYEVKDCYFLGFNIGIVSTNNNDIWIFETDFENCTGAGIEIAAGAASGGSFKISECDFTQCAKGLSLLSGVSETVSITNCSFYNTLAGTDIGLLYTPATFTTFSSLFFSNNAWNNQGSFTSGFDFSRPDARDANAFLNNNLGMENENPHAKISVNNNASFTTVTTSGTYYKASWATNAIVYTCKFGIGSTSPTSGNRFTYQPNNKRDGWAIITGNIAVNNQNRVITIAVYKNGSATGTRYGDTDLRITAANQPFQFSTVIYVPDLAKNDYLELFATSGNSGDIVTFQDIQWFINTQ